MTDSKKILVVEDEKKISDVVAAYLDKEGFIVKVTANGRDALSLVASEDPDLIVLDIMLPDLNGTEVCKEIRKDNDVPIIMLTALSSEDEKIAGLTLGADDYLTKPFSPRELVARVKTVLRRVKGMDDPAYDVLKFGGDELVIDITKHKVTLSGDERALTPFEFKLLSILARYPGRVHSRFELINKVQGYDFEGYERTIDAHIKNLRQKIESDPKNPRYIKTIFGVGYKFTDE